MSINWKTALLGGLVGLILGVALTFVFVCRMPRPWNNPKIPGRMLGILSRKLDLTPEQKESVGKILENRRIDMKALHDEVHPRFEALRTATSGEIRLVLNETQKLKFDAIEQKMKARMEKMRPSF